MMFLINGIRAEVEAVPGQPGWFQLTGKRIERWTTDVADTFGDLRTSGVAIDYNAKIQGIHSFDPEIAEKDPRFNHENEREGEALFGVYPADGTLFMLLAVNQAEYAIFRFLCPHESGDDDEFDPISDYRVEPVAA
jgi:hypothetical protein